MSNNPEIIRILFYVPGTGFGTGNPKFPYTIGENIFTDIEREALIRKKVQYIDPSKDFKKIDYQKLNKNQIPGNQKLVCRPSKKSYEMSFNEKGGSTGGHTYARLASYNSMAKKYNQNIAIPQKKSLFDEFDIYTVSDKPYQKDNLDFVLSKMKDKSYFHVCLAASKGDQILVQTLDRYSIDTTVLLINGAGGLVYNYELKPDTKIRAMILTHGEREGMVVNQKFINKIKNSTNTDIFVYSNIMDDHNQASLILPSKSGIDKSCVNKTNREYAYSYLPILVSSLYNVGYKNIGWDFLSDYLKKDRFVNLRPSLLGVVRNDKQYGGKFKCNIFELEDININKYSIKWYNAYQIAKRDYINIKY